MARSLYCASELRSNPEGLLSRAASSAAAGAAAAAESNIAGHHGEGAKAAPQSNWGSDFDRIYTSLVVGLPTLCASAALADNPSAPIQLVNGIAGCGPLAA